MNYAKCVIPFLTLLLIPVAMSDTFAQSVNDDYPISNSTLSGFISDDGTVGPVGIVNELYKAHSDVTNIMIDHSKGNFSIAENIVFTMVLVDEENEKLVVAIDPVLLSLGLDTGTSDIQQLLDTDVNVDLSYAVFIPESHINPSSQSQINTWISLYNDRCSTLTTSALCQALIFNLQTQNHYTLNSSGMWVAPSTDTPPPAPEPPVTTTTTPSSTSISQTILFSDDFEDGTLNKWTESGESDWRADTFDENRVPENHSSSNKVAEADNCDTQCILVIKNAVDISTSTSPKLEFWRYIDRSLDNTEYLKVEVTKNGSTWIEIDKWTPENGDDDDSWHKETFDLSPYKSSNFKIRFVASMSSTSEDVGIDDVKITSQSTLSTTVKKFYGGQQIIKSQIITTDTALDFSNGTITIGATKTNGQIGFVTAGHVLEISDSTYRYPVTLGGYYLPGNTITTMGLTPNNIENYALKLEVMNPTIVRDVRGDMAFVPITESNVIISQTEIITRNGTLINVIHGSADSIPLGNDIEIYGINNNAVGTLRYNNVTASTDDGITFTNMAVGHYDSVNGDSGAPIIVTDRGINKLIGIHKGKICAFHSTDTGLLLQDVHNSVQFCPNGYGLYYKLFTPFENIKSILNLR